MVLELKPPHGTDLKSLHEIVPTLAAYALSFVFVGIYWNNHHHMLRASSGIDGRSMWANLHLLFWLSLAPFTTNWLGENPSAAVPTHYTGSGYSLTPSPTHCCNGAGCGERPRIAVCKGREDRLQGKISPLLYLCAIGLAFVSPIVSDVLFVTVAVIWFVPDRRFEPVIASGVVNDATVSAIFFQRA